jgi:hypothetical protein
MPLDKSRAKSRILPLDPSSDDTHVRPSSRSSMISSIYSPAPGKEKGNVVRKPEPSSSAE